MRAVQEPEKMPMGMHMLHYVRTIVEYVEHNRA
jgi:hypothetical protein